MRAEPIFLLKQFGWSSLIKAFFPKILRRQRATGPVIVCPVENARRIALETKAGMIASIADPELRKKVRDWIGKGSWKCCELDFHDIERAAPGLIEPQRHHLETALKAGNEVASHLPIIVHCQAGISRSSAVALTLSIDRLIRSGEGANEAVEKAIDELGRYAPHARPNMHIVDLAASILPLDGAVFRDKAWLLHCR
jgi:predicted protein tyrosine phosphatase